MGILRLLNSRKVNRIAAFLVGGSRLKAMKEAAGLGQTLFVMCRSKRNPQSM
jgi:hypothetical protein